MTLRHRKPNAMLSLREREGYSSNKTEIVRNTHMYVTILLYKGLGCGWGLFDIIMYLFCLDENHSTQKKKKKKKKLLLSKIISRYVS